MHRLRNLLATILLSGCCCLPATAHATQSVELHASLTPERLGHETTVGLGFQILTQNGQVPSPLTSVDVHYPAHLGIALSGLGFASCPQATLEQIGRQGCPPDSFMGYGTAIAKIPIGPAVFSETAQVTIFRAPAQEGEVGLLFHAEGATPVSAEVVLPGLLLSAPPPFAGHIEIKIPLVPSLPGGPNVAVVSLRLTIGQTEKIFYYEHVNGKTLRYHPRGILLPNSCPPGGFPFAASFTFEDGTSAATQTKVPCPHARGHTRAAKRQFAGHNTDT